MNTENRTMGTYQYKIKSTGSNSNKFGLCDVCKRHVSETFIQQERKSFYSAETNQIELTHAGCITRFGHYDCLKKIQK